MGTLWLAGLIVGLSQLLLIPIAAPQTRAPVETNAVDIHADFVANPAGLVVPVPADCKKLEPSSMRQPYMVASHETLSIGLSLESNVFTEGAPISVHTWVDNPTDVDAYLMTCRDLELFKGWAIELYDHYGKLIGSNVARQRIPQIKPCLSFIPGCRRNFPITIPPHTCVAGDRSDLAAELVSEDHPLPVGSYTIRVRTTSWSTVREEVCKPPRDKSIQSIPGQDLRFTIVHR